MQAAVAKPLAGWGGKKWKKKMRPRVQEAALGYAKTHWKSRGEATITTVAVVAAVTELPG